jgi:filamentous hemagglutinin
VADAGTPSGKPVEIGGVYGKPSEVVQNRVSELQAQIPENSRGRITMGVAIVEDANGVRSVVISTSEPRGYLRPGVTAKPGEKVIAGTGHAEADIIKYASENGLKVVDIGATRPVCPTCQSSIEPTGANVSTPLKPKPRETSKVSPRRNEE